MMNFKLLFKNRKRDKTRQNLLVSVDDRITGDQEVLTLKTTSSQNIIVEFNGQTNKMSVHPEDLQDGLNRVKDFLAARKEQPATVMPMGVNQIDGYASTENKSNEEVKKQEEKIIPVPEKKELDLSN